MGIEPTRSRASDPSTALKADDSTASNSPQDKLGQAVSEDTALCQIPNCTKHCTKCGFHCTKPALVNLPAELLVVFDAWNTLPDAIRAGIVAMVRASLPGRGSAEQ